MKIPDKVKPGSPIAADTINQLIEGLRLLHDSSLGGDLYPNDDTVSLHPFWADISYLPYENRLLPGSVGFPLQIIFTQGYVQDFNSDERFPVFRCEEERKKSAEDGSAFELVLYVSGGSVVAVRFVEEGQDDFDLEKLRDDYLDAELPVSDAFNQAVEDAKLDDLSGAKYRLRVAEFVHEVVRESDEEADPPISERRQWKCVPWLRNDVVWGGVGGGQTCPSFIVSRTPSVYHVLPNVADDKDFYVSIGTVNNVIPINYTSKHEATAGQTTTVYLACTMSQQVGDGQTIINVTQAEIKTVATDPPDLFESWSATQPRPTTINIILGYIHSVELEDDEGVGTGEYTYTVTTHHGDLRIEEYTENTYGSNVRRNIFYQRIE